MAEFKWVHSPSMVDYLNMLQYPIIVITGPSGAGKSTLADYLTVKFKDTFEIIQNYTTRPKRETDNTECFVYLSNQEFQKLIDENEFFLARCMEFPQYGYRKKDLYHLIQAKKIPIFMFRYSGLEAMTKLINNLYVIHICSDSKKTASFSCDEIIKHTVEDIEHDGSRIEAICSLNNFRNYLKIYNEYDDAFLENQSLCGFIEVLKNVRH